MVGPARILQTSNGFRAAKVLLSAAELNVFTVLAGRALDIKQLTAAIGIAERGARDFFDALVALGFLVRNAQGLYSNADDADLYLDRNKSTYIGGELDHANHRVYSHWSHLTQALRTGQAQCEGANFSLYDTLYENPTTLELFAKGMSGVGVLLAKAISKQFAWDQYNSVIDIGTAQGTLPAELARAYSHLSIGGFDLPSLEPTFRAYMQAQGVAHRAHFHAGDFLQEPLPRADVIVFSRVLHNWNLDTKQTLLAKAFEAVNPGGQLIVCERLIDDERNKEVAALLASLNMLIVTPGGFDFTGADCYRWMRDAGFDKMRREALGCGFSMIIGTKMMKG